MARGGAAIQNGKKTKRQIHKYTNTNTQIQEGVNIVTPATPGRRPSSKVRIQLGTHSTGPRLTVLHSNVNPINVYQEESIAFNQPQKELQQSS